MPRMTQLPILMLAFTSLLGAADVAGAWQFNMIGFGEEFFPARLELNLIGDKLAGKLNDLPVEGSARDDAVQFTVKRPNGDTFATLEGRLSGNEMTGTAQFRGDRIRWIARRIMPASASPQTRIFEPTEFHRFFSGTIPPALHINPGDTVRTTTVDAGGRDAKNVRRSNGGNPETGPFYVEGALPGDTLVVKFNRIRLNRDSAGSGDRIVPSAVQADYYRDAKFDEKFNSEWKLDRETGAGMLAKPTE